MALQLQYGLKQQQKLVMTQAVRQGIELLQLNTLDLYDRIEHELIENPVIEEIQTETTDEFDGPSLISEIDDNLSWDNSQIRKNEENEIKFGETSDSGFTNTADAIKKRDYLESIMANEETLYDHLLWQAKLTADSEDQYGIFESIITSLDEKGFLQKDIESYSDEVKKQRAEIEKVISAIQLFDPVGCAAKDVHESLIIQSKHYFAEDTLLQDMIRDYFVDLEKMNYEKIAKGLHISLQETIQRSKIIQKTLDPYPGQQYSTKEIRYIIPDIEVKLMDGEIIVTLNDDWVPRLMINSYYINYLKKKNVEQKSKEYIQEKVQSAKYLIKNISSRRDTILKVVRSIMDHQIKFLEKGPGNLRPLTNHDVAQEIEMHESTVSRVTSNKFVQTSWGVFDLKYFFVTKLKSNNVDSTSSDRVMSLIKDIVDQENPEKPMSDEEIVNFLKKNGIEVARRTVAKYRGILEIPSSSKRKKINKIKSEESI